MFGFNGKTNVPRGIFAPDLSFLLRNERPGKMNQFLRFVRSLKRTCLGIIPDQARGLNGV